MKTNTMVLFLILEEKKKCTVFTIELSVPWTIRRPNQSILKEVNPEYSWEGLMLKLNLQYFGHLMQRADSLEKILVLGKIEDRRRRGQQRMRWLDGINGHKFERALGGGEGHESLVCCSPWGCKESDMTVSEQEQQNLCFFETYPYLEFHAKPSTPCEMRILPQLKTSDSQPG